MEKIRPSSKPGVHACALEMEQFELPLIGIVQGLIWPEEVDRCLIHEHQDRLALRIGTCSAHK